MLMNIARSLISLGVKQGSKVAVWATNFRVVHSLLATTKIGAVLVYR
jgi:fatty-acyl-CoA synthase